MSTEKNVVATTTDTKVSNHDLRAAQAAAAMFSAGLKLGVKGTSVTTKALYKAGKAAKYGSDLIIQKNKIDRIIQRQQSLLNQLDDAKSQYPDICYMPTELALVGNNASLEQMKLWVQQSNQSLNILNERIDNEITQAETRHQARLKKAKTFNAINSYHEQALLISNKIASLYSESKKAYHPVTMIVLPSEHCNQSELDQKLKEFKESVMILEKQLSDELLKSNLAQSILDQQGSTVKATTASQRNKEQRNEMQQRCQQKLKTFLKQEMDKNQLEQAPSHTRILVNYCFHYDDLDSAKHQIKTSVIKKRCVEDCINKATQMLANPPTNSTNNIELAQRWNNLMTSLIQVQQGNRNVFKRFRSLCDEFDACKKLEQDLLNDAYIKSVLEERLASSGLFVANDTRGIQTIYEPNNDDVIVEVKQAASKAKGMVNLTMNQVLADDLSESEIQACVSKMENKLTRVFENPSNAQVKSTLRKSRDKDTKIMKRKRDQLRQKKIQIKNTS